MCKVYININENNANENFIWDLQPKKIRYKLNGRKKTIWQRCAVLFPEGVLYGFEFILL